MEHLDAGRIEHLTTLLERTEEFMDFFYHAEAKMMKWRHEITQQANAQHEQLNFLKVELDKIQHIISATNIDCFRATAEETISQSDDCLHSLEHTEQQLLRQIHDHRAELTRITQHAMTRITQKTSQAVNALDKKLTESHTTPCPPIVNQSLDIIEEPDEPKESEKQLEVLAPKNMPFPRYIEWRSVALTLVTSLITVLIFGLYVNNEYPWEMHQTAVNERDAGKILLNAWPALSYEEKNKILYQGP